MVLITSGNLLRTNGRDTGVRREAKVRGRPRVKAEEGAGKDERQDELKW
jgi:hypothetical protein